jgi:hypothetical protein
MVAVPLKRVEWGYEIRVAIHQLNQLLSWYDAIRQLAHFVGTYGAQRNVVTRTESLSM